MILNDLKDYIKGDFLIAGVGNELKEIDSIGVDIAKEGKEKYPDEFIICGIAPENWLGEIITILGKKTNKEKQKILIIVDAVDFDSPDQEDIKVLFPENLSIQGISSHSLSLNFIGEYLKNFNIETIIIGIKPTAHLSRAKKDVISLLFSIIETH